MKKFIGILAILMACIILVQVASMFLPFFNLTPIKDRINKDPQPTNYSIQEYCWTQTRILQKIFEEQFERDYGVEYYGNAYLIDLVLMFITGVLSIAFLIINALKNFRKSTSGKAITVLCYIANGAWVYFVLVNLLTNFILTLGSYLWVLNVWFIAVIPVAVLLVLRLVLNIIDAIKDYRAEYCV